MAYEYPDHAPGHLFHTRLSPFSSQPHLFDPSPSCALQEVEISLDDVCSVDEPKRLEQYHFAMGGKSFAVITEHFQDLLQKVGGGTGVNVTPAVTASMITSCI